MTVVLYVLGVLFMALGVGLSIALHEIGHLVPAKKFGVKVTQYMVGFGPTMWSRRRGETEYGIKAIPLGGYIRMIGMFPPRPGDHGKVRASSTGRFSQLIDEARESSLEEIQPGEEKRVFYNLSVPKKVIVMLGGPMMNFLIAVVLLTGLITIYGLPTVQPGAQVAEVYRCALSPNEAASATNATTCAVDKQTPAFKAGLKPGDKLVAIDGTTINRTSDIATLIRPRVNQPTTITIERAGSTQQVTLSPMANDVAVLDAQGQPVVGADGKVQTQRAGFVGITSAPITAVERQPITAAPAYIGDGLAMTAGVILRIPQKMVGVAQAAFGDGARDPNGPISVVGVGRIAGEVSSGQVSLLAGDAAAKFALLIQLLASLNLALFVFNLIPLLPLDGGHVAGALWEGVKRRVASLRGKPDPGPVDVAKALPVAYVVSMGLIVMSALLIYADVVNPIKLG